MLIPAWSRLFLTHRYTKTFRVSSANLWKFKEGRTRFFFLTLQEQVFLLS